jgi:hypothetical protein
VRAKSFSGKTFFVKKKLKLLQTVSYYGKIFRSQTDLQPQNRTAESTKMANLLSVPIHKMMDQLSEQAVKQLNRP